ncbi:MAG TPA: Uma2 family endonuclease [Gemmatimonadaceae bacterium]|nr:Uma2 family endonuclease [Gemmatimonadaceae bacterium]
MAAESSFWTLDELHRLPDDGNKYELVRGKLFVTPPPARQHETIAARLARILDTFVAEHSLGLVYRPRAVLRTGDGEVEPDIMVRLEDSGAGNAWEAAPLPILVVEISSPTTRRRDRLQKRQFYLDAGVAEYWIVDAEAQVVTVSRPGSRDVECDSVVQWHPLGALQPLEVSVRELFAGFSGAS